MLDDADPVQIALPGSAKHAKTPDTRARSASEVGPKMLVIGMRRESYAWIGQTYRVPLSVLEKYAETTTDLDTHDRVLGILEGHLVREREQ